MNELDYAGKYLRNYEHNRYTAADLLPHLRQSVQPILVQPDYVDFPDVSLYQGEINWDVMATRTNKICIRAGQNNWVDPQFERNWMEAKRRGFYRSSYWFSDGRRHPHAQAELWASLLQGDPPELPIFADWERNYGGAYEGLENVTLLMQRMEALTYFTVGMYTGYYWFIENTSPITHASQFNYIKTRPLWLAWYASPSVVQVPRPWTTWEWWQYGTPAEGHAYGVETVEIDKNKFNGNEQAWSNRYGGINTPPGDDPMNVTGTVTATSLRVRATPNGTILGQIPNGTQVQGVLENGWISGTFNGLTGYISAEWVNWTEVPAGTKAQIEIVYDASAVDITLKAQ